MVKITHLFSVFIALAFIVSVYGAGITFTFENIEITGTSPKYYEFDIMVAADVSGTRIGDCIAYINYDTLGFGTNIAKNNKVTVTKGTLIQGDVMGSPLYSDPDTTDNTSSKLAIAVLYNFETSPTWANLLPTSPTQWVHVKIEIANESETAGLSFDEALMADQQYESDNSTRYGPVTADDTDDSTLPVQGVSVKATIESAVGITLLWQTESEVNSAGFHVWRSDREETGYVRITTALIPSHGNTSSRHEYTFLDKGVEKGKTYWYKIEEISTDGESVFYGPIYVQNVTPIPDQYMLSQNYPNPFNPATTLEYDLPEEAEVNITVYSILGQRIKTLINEKKQAGHYQLTWDGTDESNHKVPSGIYLVRMDAGEFSAIRKITMMR